jgi:hypothetical protein
MGSYGVCWRIFLRRCVDPSSRRCDDRFVLYFRLGTLVLNKSLAAQHLILSTQRVTVDEPSITDDLRPSRTQSARGSTGRSSGRGTGPSRFFGGQNTQPNPETQPDVFMLSGNQKTHYEPAQRDSHFDLEAASITKGRSGAV